MILTETQLRALVREALKNDSKAAKALGAEYLYALLQPAVIDSGNLDLKKISLPVHRQREELYLDDNEEELPDKGEELDKKRTDTQVYTADIPHNYINPDQDLKIKL